MSGNLERIDSFYYSRCTLFSAVHPISKEDYTTRLYYFTMLHTALVQEREFSPYINAAMKVYCDRFNIKTDDYQKIVGNSIKNKTELLEMLKVIRKNYYSFTRWRLYKHNYKYLFIAHVLLSSKNLDQLLKSSFFMMIKDYLKIKEDTLTQIISFVKKLNSGDVQGANNILGYDKALKELHYFMKEIEIYKEESQKASPKALVIATMSAGKSTFINSVIGRELLPSKNEACTAKVVSLKNHRQIPFFMGYKSGKNFELDSFITCDRLTEWNLTSEDERIYLEGHLQPFLPFDLNVTLIDTPGTNNSREKAHSDTTFKRLEENDYQHIFYVMNATNLATDDDRHLLNQLLKHVPKEKWNQNITFIINKMDEIDIEADESIGGIIHTVSDYLTSLGIQNPRFIPYSSYAAKLFQIGLSGQDFTRKETKDFHFFMQLFLDDHYSMPRYANLKTALELSDILIENKLEQTPYKNSDLMTAIRNSGYFTVMNCLHEIASGDYQS
jgi:hypothetical protein